MKPQLKISTPDGSRRIVLHACCAPCLSAILECLTDNGIEPLIYYFNPNIYPDAEYLRRRDECTRHAQRLGLEIVDGDYDHNGWLGCVAGMEGEPERGARCRECFRMRLEQTARLAAERGITVFTTTLASSRWKRLDQINDAGRAAAALYPQTIFWEQNWRRGGLQERRNELLREFGFYNQLYCGCEFSAGDKAGDKAGGQTAAETPNFR